MPVFLQEKTQSPQRTSRRSRTIPVETPPPTPATHEPPEIKVTEEQPHQQTPEQLLDAIFQELKSLRRAQPDGEFSIIRLLAGLLQVVVFFCLLVSIWLLMQTPRDNELVLVTIGFAIVLQLVALTFYLMQGRK